MLLNYLKVFLRLFARNRVFTLINLLGLSTGITCFVLIRLYVINETVYDRHLPDVENTYRLAMKGDMSGFSFESAVMGGPFGRAIREDVPEVHATTTFYKFPRPVLLSKEENRYYEESIIYADSMFLDFFGYEVLLGDPGTMLDAPFSMILTRTGARKYFGDENPIGKVISWNNQRDYTITGVIEDQSLNSHLKFNILASFNSLLEQDRYRNLLTTFFAFVTYNYLKIDNTADLQVVEEKIAGVVEKNMGEGMKESGSHFELYLQSVNDIHLNSDLVHELEPNGSRSSVFIFSAISMLILLIACVNFINLTTARSAGRLREIRIRQTNGAGKDRLFRQFIFESVFFSLFSVLIAGVLAELIKPWFFNFSGINSLALPFSRWVFYAMLLLLGVVIGVIAGLYPAVHISRLQWLVSGTVRKKPMKKVFRNVLVVIQLGITLFLVFNTLLIYKQLQFVNTTDIGINKDDMIVIPMRSPLMYNRYEVLKNEMLALPSVKEVTATSAYLGNFQQRRGFFVEGFDRNDMWMLHHVYVEPNYTEVMETGIVMGRSFRKGSRADSNAVIINAAMMEQAGWENPIDKKITMPAGGTEIEYTVIGLLEDFNYTSVHSKIESLLIFNSVKNTRYLCLRISGNNPGLDEISEKWSGMYPEYPFDFIFQEDYYDNMYREDQRMGRLFIYFSSLAILISVLGLFGLVLFTSSRRNKEIGIRKVMGGEISRLVFMLLKEYPVLLGIAALFALPASWYFARDWLENFALKTEISVWIYIISLVLVLLICIGTILIQTLRTASTNPVNALRYE